MKFKDISVGDKVLVNEVVMTSCWGMNEKNFFVLKEVAKVTPKQFTVGTDRYRKYDGSMVASNKHGVAYRQNEIISPSYASVTRKAEDQTSKMNALKKNLKLSNDINNLLSKFKVNYGSEHLIDISIKVHELSVLINTNIN